MKINVRMAQKEHLSVLEEIEKMPPGEPWISQDGYVKGYRFRHRYVDEVVTQRVIQSITWKSPLLIKAQTGAGKSHLIFSKLLPLVKNQKKRIMILAGRTALVEQYKRQAVDVEMPYLQEELKAAIIKLQDSFGAMEVRTYQSVLARIKAGELNPQSYDVVVFDECHYFVQDASFSRETEAILDVCLEHFKRCKRLYLSATPECAAEIVIEKERESAMKDLPERIPWAFYLPPSYEKPVFQIIDIDQDYSFIRPIFFTRIEEMLRIIQKDETEDKYLICVDSKAKGQKIEEELSSSIADYIDAELKNSSKSETIQDIIATETFRKKVLVVTSFLDVGVNLSDNDIKNVVIFSTDSTHFRQAIGRKRVRYGEKVDLFIFVPKVSALNRKVGKLREEYSTMRTEIQKKEGGNLFITSELPFPLWMENDNGKFQISHNSLSLVSNRWRVKELEQLCAAALAEDIPDEGIAKTYLRWLGIEEKYRESRWLGRKPDEQLAGLTELFETVAGKTLTETETAEFREQVQKVCADLGIRCGAKRSRIPDVTVINRMLEAQRLPYAVERVQNRFSIRRR